MAKTTIKKSKKTRQIIPHGQAHINATFNNTIVSITDDKGSVLTWSSGWSAGFKGARESTPYAAQVIAESKDSSFNWISWCLCKRNRYLKRTSY